MVRGVLHTILALFIVVVFVGQVSVLFYRTRQLEKRQDKQGGDLHQEGETFLHALERLEDWMDKRLIEVNQRIDGLRSEMNQRLSDIKGEISKMNQNHIDHLSHHQNSTDS